MREAQITLYSNKQKRASRAFPVIDRPDIIEAMKVIGAYVDVKASKIRSGSSTGATALSFIFDKNLGH